MLDAPLHTITLPNKWRSEYSRRRYLEHLSDEELRQRQRDVFQNVYSFDDKGEMTVSKRDKVWDHLMAHVLTEAEMRGVPLEHPLRVSEYRKQKRASELWAAMTKPDVPFLVKYGERTHLEPMLDRGIIRLSPASRYRDALKPAIRDTELEFTDEWHGVTVSAPKNGDYSIPPQRWTRIPVIGNIKAHLSSGTDYYTACFSNRFDSRLFDDFGADACLIVSNPVSFIDRIRYAVEQRLPNWKFSKGNVQYRDPFHPVFDTSIVYAKHFRYAYQDEFRMAWQPPSDCDALDYLNLTLEPVCDIADLFVL